VGDAANQNLIDIAVIGGGPAGLTAALYGARGNARVVVFERAMMGGQITTTAHVENYPAFPEGIGGMDLGELMHQQATALGAEVMQFVDIVGLTVRGDGLFELSTGDGDGDETFIARSVVLATGAVPSKLGIAGEAEYTGHGVSWCATCDAMFFRDKVVAVIGGGNAAIEEAIFLTKFASKVYLVHRREAFRADAVVVDRARATERLEIVTPYVPIEVVGDGSKVTGLVLEKTDAGERKELVLDGIFEFVGVNPQNVLGYDLVEHDERGYVITGEDGSTKVPGLFCAGDIRLTLED
jgi:thioredoxin reductase (NADPH)